MSSTNSDAHQDPDCGLARGVLIAVPFVAPFWGLVGWWLWPHLTGVPLFP